MRFIETTGALLELCGRPGAPALRKVAGRPTPGQILAEITVGEEGGADRDRDWPARAARAM